MPPTCAAVPCNVAVSVTLAPSPTVMFAPDVTPADACSVVTVGVLQFEKAIGPAKSLRTEVNEGDERVCGKKVLMQPVKPSAVRSMPPSMNALVSSVVVPAPLPSRHTQPPHVIGPAFTPNTDAGSLTATYWGSPLPGFPLAAGSQTVKSLAAL